MAALIWTSLVTAGCSSGTYREVSPATTVATTLAVPTTLVTPTTLAEAHGIGPADLLAADGDSDVTQSSRTWRPLRA